MSDEEREEFEDQEDGDDEEDGEDGEDGEDMEEEEEEPPSIYVSLASNRYRTGFIMVVDREGRTRAGPFRVLGKADNAKAAEKGNSDRDPTMPYGDTPTGVYSSSGVESSGTGTRFTPRSYGSNGVIRIEGTSGDALRAVENGRTGLLIHGGALSSNGRLRATHGCLRVSDDDMESVFRALDGRQPHRIEVLEDEPPPINDFVVPDPLDGEASIHDPLLGPGEYLANRRTKIIHDAGRPCSWVGLMNDKNKEYLDGQGEGYGWCSRCFA